MTAIAGKIMSVEEYIQFELKSELRHEYINGQLIEMPGEKLINNKMATFLTVFLFTLLEEKGYTVYSHDVKVKIAGENKYYYPDWLVAREEPGSTNNAYSDYIIYEPELIAEVLSKTSRVRDTVDKYLDYIKIPSLKYYLIIDPERTHVTVHAKTGNGDWEAEVYSNRNGVIGLPLLEIALPMKVIYR